MKRSSTPIIAKHDVVSKTLMVAIAIAGWCGTASAQDSTGVTVIATGTTSSPPDRIEMAVTVTGGAELAGEAATKYRGQRERLLETLESLGIDGLTTRPGTMTVTSGSSMIQNQYGQMVPDPNAGSFNVTEKVVIDFPAGENTLDTITKIYDVGKDLGITFVPPRGQSIVEPRFTETEEAEKAAFEKAMAEAKKKGETLASLAGRSLGQVVSVSVTSVHAAQQQTQADRVMTQWATMVGMEMGVDTSQLSANASLTRQKTTATLQVRFELN